MSRVACGRVPRPTAQTREEVLSANNVVSGSVRLRSVLQITVLHDRNRWRHFLSDVWFCLAALGLAAYGAVVSRCREEVLYLNKASLGRVSRSSALSTKVQRQTISLCETSALFFYSYTLLTK